MKKIFFILTVFLLTTISLKAEDVRFSASGPGQVIKGQQFQVEFTLYNASGKDFRLPEFSGCTVLYDAVSRGSSMSIVNGNVSRQSTETYVITLRADKEGSFTIPAATIKADGKSLQSNTLSLKILPPDKAPSSGTPDPYGRNQSIERRSSGDMSDSQVFVRTILSKTKVYEQEAILATIKLYTRAAGIQIENYSFPSFEGFVVQDIPLPQNASFELENYNGLNYKTAVLKKSLIFPQHSGKITVSAGKYDIVAQVYQLVNGPFGAMRVPQEVKKTVASNVATVDVMALPAGKPVSFMGGVGSFSISSSISSEKVRANEAVTIKLVIKGSGNIKYLKNPDIKFPSDFETYDPKVDVNVNTSSVASSGTRTIEYTTIPRFAGEFTIPGVEFSYFNLNTKKYETLTTPSYKLMVEKGAPGSSTVTNFTNKEDVKLLNQDIHYIRLNKMNLQKEPDIYVSGWGYWLWYIIPALLFMAFMVINRKQAAANANITLMKTKKANKVATKRLKIAGKYLKEHQKEKFYDEVLKAMWGYLSDKLSLPLSELTKDNVSAELNRYGAGEELIRDIINILNTCEFAQYAPSQSDEAMDKLYADTVDAIGKMENTKKIK
ncbi:BatD family protein [Barnesiella propionica]|uniref:BatD family protein n=1 Tax=Barnesiella propionica TaxID=2981781 RepID=UPI0011C9FC90|nr:BatD family protein [Barnesiella propionica]MCU6768192.1 BatD family protein [Barnesiella propionica]